MAKFYTQTGDDGYTGLLGEGRAVKYDPRIETIGFIDEANAAIGFARSISQSDVTRDLFLTIQRDLYHIMTEISLTTSKLARFNKFSDERVSWLENQIDRISQLIDIPNEFIVPGDSPSGAAVDLARTIVRKAERNLAKLIHEEIIRNKDILRYMNRLSSLCFALELLENKVSGSDKPTFAKLSE
jgi:cob(I)alamin adenosyltransferase